MVLDVNLSQTISELLQSRYTKEVSDSIQRLTSGLKINDSADDVGGLVSSNSLQINTSALRQGIENGNEGLALVQISNKALDNQKDILTQISDKLKLARLDSTSTTSQEAIRVDIVDLLTQFNDIASDTEYNNTYTLQKSDTDTDFSLPITIIFNASSSSTVTTEAIKSNTEGLGLDTLKNLNTSELTATVAVTQLDVVSDALETIEDYENSFRLTQEEIQSAVTNLTGIEKTTATSRDNILNADLDKENATLDKFKLLEQASEFAIVQANITQSIVLKLLATTLNVTDTFTSDSKTNNRENDNSYTTDKKSYVSNTTSYDSYDSSTSTKSVTPSFTNNLEI